METVLVIEGSGFPPLSARGCQQILSCVNQGEFRRTVNGDLCFVGNQGGKYQSVISCEDKTVLVSDGVLARGNLVRVGCIQRLWQTGHVDIVELEKEAVEGSIGVVDCLQEPVPFEVINSKTIRLLCDEEQIKDCFVSYRPWLWMRVIQLRLFTDEWGLKVGWRLDLEEV